MSRKQMCFVGCAVRTTDTLDPGARGAPYWGHV